MGNRARDQHRALDRAFLEALHRDGDEGASIEAPICRPIRFRRSDLVMSEGVLLKATRLWQKTSSRNGKKYLVGRLGGLKVLIFENADKKSDSDPTHVLLLGEAEDRPRPVEKTS